MGQRPAEFPGSVLTPIDAVQSSCPPGAALTSRKRDVTTLLAQGLTIDEIGARLCIDQKTMRSDIRRSLSKWEREPPRS
jgi:DNA-binding NarL/FixJ family response regulator